MNVWGPKSSVCPSKPRETKVLGQGRILAVWILAPKLPNSDLKIAVDFWVDFFSYFFQGKRPQKIHQKIHGKIHPGIRSEKFPSDFCRSLLLILGRISRNFCRDIPGAPKKFEKKKKFVFNLWPLQRAPGGYESSSRIWNFK